MSVPWIRLAQHVSHVETVGLIRGHGDVGCITVPTE